MARPRYRRVLTGLRLTALGSFLLLGALIWVRYAQALTQLGTATAAQRVAATTSRLLSVAVDVRDASQGFALTGDEMSLAHIREWRSVTPAAMAQLRQAAEGNAEERDRATDFLATYADAMSISDDIVAARRAGGILAAQQVMVADAAPAKLDQLRASATALSTLARQRFVEDRAETRTSRQVTGYLMLGTFVAAIGMFAYAGFYMRRELRRRGDAEDALLVSRADVERQIEERTRELSAARSEAEAASAVKDQFLAAVSHELRTPLNAIVGWTQILKIDTGENRARAVEAIERNAHVQTRLIDDLLDVSRMIQGRFGLALSLFDLRVAVQAAFVTIAPAAAAKGVELIVHAAEDVMLRGDEARLQQVAWNLLSNAVKFTPRGGSITVDLARVGAHARLRVTDTGDGIDPAFLPQVFDPFRQGSGRSPQLGMGLGLAIVRQIVDLHGGTVLAASDGRGKGASFTVALPAIAAPAASARLPVSRSAREGVSGRVLVVEDDADGAETLAALLNHGGCDVRVAGTVADALAAFEEALPDVLLCDIGLPDGDGCGLLRELRQRFPHEVVPAIALSAFAGEEDRRRALDAGFAAYVTKPYEVEQLFHEIRRVGRRRVH